MDFISPVLAQSSDPAATAMGGIIVLVFMLIQLAALALGILGVIGLWKMFSKAGEPGWTAIIPVVNLIFMCKVAGRPWWWLFLFLIPIVNIVMAVILYNDLSRSFGRGLGTTIGLLFLTPIFFMILGFGSATYKGPAAA